MIKKIIALFTLTCVLCTSVAFAEDRSLEELYEMYMSDVADINRIYKYDLAAKTQAGNDLEELKHRNAVNTVLTLGLMQHNEEGRFNEEGMVPLKEFAKIIMTLAADSVDVFSQNYEEYPDNRYLTQDEAIYYLVGVLGYDAYEVKYPKENARSYIAHDLRLFNGITYAGSKNITRGELAQLIYNALNTEILSMSGYGNTIEYEKNDGNTLLYNRYDAVFVSGMVTEQYGINIDSEKASKENTIEIDGADYYLDDVAAPDLLGHTAFAIARADGLDRYRLLCIDYDQNDETVSIDIADIKDIKSGTIYYIEPDKSEKKVKTSGVKRIVVNNAILATTDIKEVIFEHQGEVRICNNIYTDEQTVYISDLPTYKVYGISPEISEKIYLDHGALWKDETYIDLQNMNVHVIKNGKEATLNDIKAGNIISVAENAHGTDIKIIVSDEVVSGYIEEMADDIYYIGGDSFQLLDCYNEFRLADENLPEIKLNTEGDFLLDYTGKIASFVSTSTDFNLAYMRNIGSQGSNLSTKYMVRLFTTDNEWKNYELEDKVTLDGKTGVLASEAVSSIQNYGEGIDNLIRYKLSSDNKIKFIDTVRDMEEEEKDLHAMRYHGSWTGTFNWTAGNKSHKCIGAYVGTSETKVFTVPKDVEDEDEYLYAPTPSFSEKEFANLKMYCVNDFMVPSVIISEKGASGSLENGLKFMVVTKLLHAFDEDGNDSLVVEAFDGSTIPNWQLKKYFVSKAALDVASALKAGDVILTAGTIDRIDSIEVTAPVAKWNEDIVITPGASYIKAMGTVINVDAKAKFLRIRTGEEEHTILIQSLGLYEKLTGNTYNIGPEEVQIGDRVFFGGQSGRARCLILR